jgi:hypothetical protein
MTYFSAEPHSLSSAGQLSPLKKKKKLSGLWGYKVSKEKAQLYLPQVTYLGVVLKGQAP